jgi:hypothetical protein
MCRLQAMVQGPMGSRLFSIWAGFTMGRARGYTSGLAFDHNGMVAVLRDEAAACRPGVEVRFGARAIEVLREGRRVVGARTEQGEEPRRAGPYRRSAVRRHGGGGGRHAIRNVRDARWNVDSPVKSPG